MGFFSYKCKECGHPMLSHGAVDKGINEWMVEAVALTTDGSRMIGEYNGYGRVVGGEDDEFDYEFDYEFDDETAAWVHKACWESAGKPDYDHYGSGSDDAEDQGWFFKDGDHDMIDPRIKDEAERNKLLEEGIKARIQLRHNQRAEAGE
jgi:hypothetical protein